MNRSRIRALASAAPALCAAALLLAAGGARAQDDLVTLRFQPEPDKALGYDGASRKQLFQGGRDIVRNTSQHVEISFGEALGDSAFQLEIKYVKCTSSMLRGGDLQEWSDPIKAEGRTLRVSVDELGEVIDVAGFIPGLPRGRETKKYVERWFFKLPSEPVGKGSEWTVEIDEQSAEDEAEKFSRKGNINFVLKKFGKKRGIAVAEIEGRGVLDMLIAVGQGMLEGPAETRIKAAVALQGGYIVELSSTVDIKGKLVQEDPISGRTQELNLVLVDSDEIKLAR